jgi:TfoX/Sxy family transcriptional regulator of competence genes
MGAAKKSSIPADKSELYEKVIATHPKIERKGDRLGYTSLNGHMFSLLGPSGTLALRLPEEERAKFLHKYKTTLFEAYGAVMKEYVAVPEALFKNTKQLQKYLAMSYDYIATLKPKPTKAKKKR